MTTPVNRLSIPTSALKTTCLLALFSLFFWSSAEAGQPMRYLRFDGYYSSDAGQISLYEIEAIDSSRSNRALRADATSNSGIRPDRLTDGTIDRFPFSTNPNNPGPPSEESPHRITIDLGDKIWIESINVHIAADYGSTSVHYGLFGSLDGLAWEPLGYFREPQGISSSTVPTISLRNLDLSYADLSGADLNGIDLSGADLTNADLSTATGLDTTIFTGATLDGILLPPGYSVMGSEVVGGNRPDPVAPFRAWARQQGLPDSVGENARSSSGHPMLLHFAFDVAPNAKIPDSRLPRMTRGATNGGPVFRYAVPKGDHGLVMTPQVSTNPADGWIPATAVMVEEDASDEHYEVTLPATSTGFFRLQITEN